MAYAEEGSQKATLINGAVKVIHGNAQSILRPGQQAQTGSTASAIQVISDANIDEVLAWKNGAFLFQSATLEDILRQLSRWYDVDVKYEGTKPGQRFTANMNRNNNLSDILRVLEISGYRFEIEGKMIVVKN
jgi:ferric-dicitrate binding protein FerR (iron transport regulator)